MMRCDQERRIELGGYKRDVKESGCGTHAGANMDWNSRFQPHVCGGNNTRELAFSLGCLRRTWGSQSRDLKILNQELRFDNFGFII